MNRRTVLKAGAVLAATSHSVVMAPENPVPEPVEDPRITIKRLSWQIADLMGQVTDYDRISIQASSREKYPVLTLFTL